MRHDKQNELLIERVIAQIEARLQSERDSSLASASRIDETVRTLAALRSGKPFVTVSRVQPRVFHQPGCGYSRDDYDYVTRAEAEHRGLRPCRECA